MTRLDAVNYIAHGISKVPASIVVGRCRATTTTVAARRLFVKGMKLWKATA